jgi:pimeloyl-ACP methyl ester carboxylesterase
MLNALLEFIEATIPNEHFLLVGESYGAYLARGVAYHKRDMVDGLLLICPCVIAEREKRNLPRHVTLVEDPALLSSLQSKEADDFKSIAVVQTPQTWRRCRDEIICGVKIADEAFLTKLQTEHYAFSFDLDRLLGVFERPSLVLVGRQDASVGYSDAWSILGNYPRSTFAVLDRAGHNLQIEQEKLFNTLVNEWLDRVEEPLKLPNR